MSELAGATECELLVVAAHELELRALRSALQASGELDHVRCAVVGVGMPAAGAGTERALAALRPRRVVLLGSCGAYPGVDLPILSLLVPHAAALVDSAALDGRVALPEAMAQRCRCDDDLRDSLPHARDGVVATTLGITVDDALAQLIATRSGCSGENMEALAVGLACAARGVRFSALLCCTNQVGAGGRAQWAQHHAEAAEVACDAMLSWLSAAGRADDS